jgi:hypothetical protein
MELPRVRDRVRTRRAFVITSSLAAEDVLKRLADATEDRRFMHWSRNHRLFQGTIAGERFEISRIIHYKNSSLPQIIGQVMLAPTTKGTRVVGTMQMAKPVRPLLALCACGVALVGILSVVIQASTRQLMLPQMLIPLGFLVYVLALWRYFPRDFFRQTDVELRYFADLVDASSIEWVDD